MSAEHYGIIAVSRGGGDSLEVFNKISLAEKVIDMKSLFVKATGHKDDLTLLQRVADKSFITRSELGQFLNDTYNHTIEELQNSKARLIESVEVKLSIKKRDDQKESKQLYVQVIVKRKDATNTMKLNLMNTLRGENEEPSKKMV